MSAIKCPSCGSMISSKAHSCPRCGYVFDENSNSDERKMPPPPDYSVLYGPPIPDYKRRRHGGQTYKKQKSKEQFDWTIVLWVIGCVVTIIGAVCLSGWLKATCPILFFIIVLISWLDNKFGWFD